MYAWSRRQQGVQAGGLPALPEEVALHEEYLDAMEKEAKGPSLWRKLLSSSTS